MVNGSKQPRGFHSEKEDRQRKRREPRPLPKLGFEIARILQSDPIAMMPAPNSRSPS
jgi:hypothetical protein